MGRLLTILCLCAVTGAVVYFAWDGDDDTDRRSQQVRSSAPLTATGRTPAFYLSTTPDERLRIASQNLGKITSGRAEVLGDLKDEIALLADDPKVIDLILESWADRAAISRQEASGFADLFLRIRHPQFVEPTQRLFRHAEHFVRHKGIWAASTQAHPSLTPFLSEMYDDLLAIDPNKGENIRREVLLAAARCGGEHLPILLAKALKDPRPLVRAGALELMQEHKLSVLEGRAEPLLSDDEPAVRFYAGFALAAIGNKAGFRTLEQFLEPLDPQINRFAHNAVRELHSRDFIPALLRLKDKGSEEARSSCLLALAAFRHPETLESLRVRMKDGDASAVDRVIAVEGLGLALEDQDLELLRDIAQNGSPLELTALARSLGNSDRMPPIELVNELLESEDLILTHQMGSLPKRLGDQLTPTCERLLRDCNDVNRAIQYISCLVAIDTDAAWEVLMSQRHRWGKLIEESVRLRDLERRKEGTTG